MAFSLVKFVEDGLYAVCRTSKISFSGQKTVSAPFRNVKYPASLITKGGESELRVLKERLEEADTICMKSAPGKQLFKRNLFQISIIESKIEKEEGVSAVFKGGDPTIADADEIMESDIPDIETSGLGIPRVSSASPTPSSSPYRSNVYRTQPLISDSEPDEPFQPKARRRLVMGSASSESSATNQEESPKSAEEARQPLKKKVPRRLMDESSSPESCATNRGISESPKRKLSDVKKHSCFFCYKEVTKLPRHLSTLHKNESKVAEIFSLPKNSEERHKKLLNLTRVGDFNHNMRVISLKEGSLILGRKPNQGFRNEDYAPCPDCLGFFKRQYLWKHGKVCGERSEDSLKKFMQDSKAMLVSHLDPGVNKEFNINCINQLRRDPISKVIKNDETILRYGCLLYEKYGKEQSELIRQNMRILGRLLIALNAETNLTEDLRSFLVPEKFEEILSAIRMLCVEQRGGIFRPTFDKPSLALKIGHGLRKCAALIRGAAIKMGDEKSQRLSKKFAFLMENEYPSRISSSALATLKRRKISVSEIIPLTEDLLALSKFLKKEIASLKAQLMKDTSTQSWYDLSHCVLARLVLFNKRRGGEASRLTVENYKQKKDWTASNRNQELEATLTPLEKRIACSMNLMEIIGKKGSIVPVLLTDEMVSSMDLLLEKREEIGISKNNEYFFARAYKQSEKYIRGPDALSKIVKKVALKKPQLITGTNLRKYIATVCQVLELKDNETEWLANHLGHNIKVHKEFYRLHHSAVEMTKVSRLLMAVDDGIINKFQGKSIQDINVSDLPELEADMDHEEANLSIDKERMSGAATVSPVSSVSPEKEDMRTPPKTKRRRLWTYSEKKVILDNFRTPIKMRLIPSKVEIEKLRSRYNKTLNRRSWKDIKYFVYNRITTLRRSDKRTKMKDYVESKTK